MSEYFDTLESFYNEKLKFLTKKDKYAQCNTCPGNKNFVETNKELIISCGSDDNSSCGKQIQIVFPEYIHYSSKLDELEKELEQEINWDVINKYTDVSNELESQKESISKTKEAIQYIHELFEEINLKHKQEALQTFYDNRIKKTKRTKEILVSLKNDGLIDSKKKELRKEYVIHVTEMRKEYELAKNLMDDINPYLETTPPKVTILYDKYKGESKKKKEDKKEKKKEDKKEKKKEDKKEDVVVLDINQRVRWNIGENDYMYGTIVSKKGTKIYKIKNDKGKIYMVPMKKVEVVEEGEPEPEKEN